MCYSLLAYFLYKAMCVVVYSHFRINMPFLNYRNWALLSFEVVYILYNITTKFLVYRINIIKTKSFAAL